MLRFLLTNLFTLIYYILPNKSSYISRISEQHNSCNFQKPGKAETEDEELWPNGSLQVDHPINVEKLLGTLSSLSLSDYLRAAEAMVLLDVLIQSLTLNFM